MGKHDVQKFAADAIVETDAARYLMHIGADLFTQIGDLINEGDLGSKEGIGRVFNELGGAPADIDDRRRVEVEGPVDCGEDRPRLGVVAADHNAIGMLEILDRSAFTQEFRIRDDRDPGVGTLLAQNILNLVAGSHGDGRLGDDDRRRRQMRSDLAYRVVDESEMA